MNGFELFHLKELREDEVYKVAAKNAYWSLRDRGLMTSVRPICGSASPPFLTLNHFRLTSKYSLNTI